MPASDMAADQIEEFFIEKLQFTKVPEEKRNIPPFEDAKRKILTGDNKDFYTDDEYDEEAGDSSESEIDEQQKRLAEFISQKAAEEANFDIDFDEILEVLEEQLPKIPPKPEVVQVNPPPYKMPIRYTFGKLYPKEKGDKDEKKKKTKAKPPARKKDEKPPKPIRWADAP